MVLDGEDIYDFASRLAQAEQRIHALESVNTSAQYGTITGGFSDDVVQVDVINADGERSTINADVQVLPRIDHIRAGFSSVVLVHHRADGTRFIYAAPPPPTSPPE